MEKNTPLIHFYFWTPVNSWDQNRMLEKHHLWLLISVALILIEKLFGILWTD